MLRWFPFVTILVASSMFGRAEIIELKNQATVEGRILAQKTDQLIVDIGYTVLVIPRDEVIQVTAEENSSAESETAVDRVVDEESGANGLFRVATQSIEERSVRELANELGASVVQVRTPGGLGSGFILNDEGFLITNFHVIEGETQISVEVYHQQGGQLERRSYKDIRIVAMNKFKDLALLKIDDPDAPKFSPVYLGDSDSMAVGQRVFAIGSPLGLERTVTEGILSTKTRQMQGELYLQTTAQINPGNSGGPLFNMRGEVIGVTNMKMVFGEGLGFAIPIEAVKYFLNHRDAYAYDNDNPSNPYRYLEPPSRPQETQTEDDSS